MLDRDLTDIIREDEESRDFESCLCRVVMDRKGEVSISSVHCPIHGPENSADFAQIEQMEHERRLANGE